MTSKFFPQIWNKILQRTIILIQSEPEFSNEFLNSVKILHDWTFGLSFKDWSEKLFAEI